MIYKLFQNIEQDGNQSSLVCEHNPDIKTKVKITVGHIHS